MTGKERVIQAMEFRGPDRIPIWFFNRDDMRGDVLCFGLSVEADGVSESGGRGRGKAFFSGGLSRYNYWGETAVIARDTGRNDG